MINASFVCFNALKGASGTLLASIFAIFDPLAILRLTAFCYVKYSLRL